MCGITGMIDWDGDVERQRPNLERMLRAIRHRGPDAEGIWVGRHAALAHRRLIVIDPEGGVQPMSYERGDQRVVLSFNGEIYNFRELRAELEALGHQFRTRSDTEVLLQAYVAWGEACLTKLNGIFAFAIWDEARQTLLLARDHMGVKPLFYAQRGGTILFGSELKALLAHPQIQPEVDAEGLAEVFTWAKTPGHGIYRGVAELRAGHYAVVRRDGMRTQAYWSLRSDPHAHDERATVERLRTLLEESVRRQLVSDMPLIALLSGGIDSSGLVALAARELHRDGRELHTYSIDFADSARTFQPDMLRTSLDEPWAQRVSAHVGTRHHTLLLDTPELIEHMLMPMRALDRPSGGNMDTTLYLLCRLLKQDATVAISGESADEIFGGYHWFANPDAALQIATLPWVPAVGFAQLLSPEARAAVQPEAYVARRYREALDEIPQPEGGWGDPREAKMRELFYLSQTRFMSVFMDRKDRMSMASGFEVRVPYSDPRIVEYAWNIPWQTKALGQIEKGVLRQALGPYLPEDVCMRRKSAFPSSRNPSYLRAVQGIARDIMADPGSPARALVDAQQIDALMAEDVPAQRFAWATYYLDSFIQLNAWLSEYHVRICI